MTLHTYEVIRTSPDQLVIYAHIGYISLALAVIFAALALRGLLKAHAPGAVNWGPVFGVLALLSLGLSLNHGRMVFNKASNTFNAERTHWYLATDRTATTLDDVDRAYLNRSNTTYQLCVVLHSSDKCVAVYPLDSAGGQDEAARAIDRFLLEYEQQKLSQHGAVRAGEAFSQQQHDNGDAASSEAR